MRMSVAQTGEDCDGFLVLIPLCKGAGGLTLKRY